MVVGDLHHDADFVIEAIKCGREIGVDAYLQVGDMGFWPNRTDCADFFDEVNAALQFGETWYWLDGNHDNHDMLTPGMRVGAIQHLPRGHRWSWWGKTWMAVGGGATLNRRAYTPGWDWFPKETLSLAEAEHCARPGGVDIIVSHDCPDYVPSLQQLLRPEKFPADEIAESERHRTVIGSIVDAVRPSRLIHGHYHKAHRGYRHGPDGLTTGIIGLDGNESRSLTASTLVLTAADMKEA
jgi:UDP-2,3-diacylglucosamine pyrophosphatase LpxH